MSDCHEFGYSLVMIAIDAQLAGTIACNDLSLGKKPSVVISKVSFVKMITNIILNFKKVVSTGKGRNMGILFDEQSCSPNCQTKQDIQSSVEQKRLCIILE